VIFVVLLWNVVKYMNGYDITYDVSAVRRHSTQTIRA